MASRGSQALSRDRHLRYLAPPLTLIGVLAGSAAGIVGVFFKSQLLRVGLLAPAGYLALIIGGSLVTARPMSAAARLPAAGVGGDSSRELAS